MATVVSTLFLLVPVFTVQGTMEIVPVPTPQPPSNLACKQSLTSLDCTWDVVPKCSLYDIEVAAPGLPAFMTITPSSTSVSIMDLDPGKKYSITVRAHSEAAGLEQMIAGWSVFSSPIEVQMALLPQGTPLRLRRVGAPTDHSITVAWNRSDSQESCRVGYRVQTPPSDQHALDLVWTPLAANISTTTLSGLQSGTTYFISVECDDVAASMQAMTSNRATMWIEVSRVSENFVTYPDYLANHDSGTFEGDTAFMTGVGNITHFFNFTTSPRVRYCVEIEKVDLTNISRTPSGPPNIPVNLSFTEYLSCNGNRSTGGDFKNYSCVCDNWIDRVIAHQTPEQIRQYCPNHANGSHDMECICDPKSVAISSIYTGWMPVSLPWGPSHSSEQVVPFGGWYSHPAATKCADDGTKVGVNGCTWRRHPQATMVYGADLLAHGWNRSSAATNAQVFSNRDAMRRAFDAIPTTKCCGC